MLLLSLLVGLLAFTRTYCRSPSCLMISSLREALYNVVVLTPCRTDVPFFHPSHLRPYALWLSLSSALSLSSDRRIVLNLIENRHTECHGTPPWWGFPLAIEERSVECLIIFVAKSGPISVYCKVSWKVEFPSGFPLTEAAVPAVTNIEVRHC